MKNLAISEESKRLKKISDAKGNFKKLKQEEQEQSDRDTADVLAAGQEDSAKAAVEIDRIEQRDMAEEQKARDDAMNKLDMKKKFRASYKSELAKNLSELLMKLDWVRGWSAEVIATNGSPINIFGKPFETKDGILLIVKTAKGNVMHKGMLVTGEPALDYAGLYNICLQVENTMDKARGLLLDEAPANVNGDTQILGKDGRPISSTITPTR